MGINTTGVLVVLFGLCLLSSCFPQGFHIIKDQKTWTEAQSFCRERYTDLVTIDNAEDMTKLSHILWPDSDEFWIGLYGDVDKESMESEGCDERGQDGLRKWYPPKPNMYIDESVCTETGTKGLWGDDFCSVDRQFVCYNAFSETKYVLVNTPMNWTSALKHCREHYTELASVKITYENNEIKTPVDTSTGHHRVPWKWSDDQPVTSFSNWDTNQPDNINHLCVTTTHSGWKARPCSSEYAFVCSDSVRKRMRVTLTKSDPSVDLEEMQDVILQQLDRRLKGVGLGDVQVSWVKQPDGKIFHLKETDKKKEKEKRKGPKDKSCK